MDFSKRAIIMVVSETTCYVVLDLFKPNLVGKLRNGIICIILNGMIWTP